MAGLSSDPERRQAQLANLRRAKNQRPDQPNLSHGGYAAVAAARMDAKATEVFAALAADAPLKENGGLPAADAALVRLAAECLCRLEDVTANVRDFGLFEQRGRRKGQIRPVVELEGRLRREAVGYLEQLGMTPAARAKLGLDLARTRDLAEEMSGLEGDPVEEGDDG